VIGPPRAHLFDRLRVIDDRAFRSAAMNMAVDEALFEEAPFPTLRFYRWDHPAISFGYFGKLSEVVPFSQTHDIVRRWTGGGIVFHGNDLTYSIIIPAGVESSANSSREIYTALHTALCDALKNAGHRAELALTDSVAQSQACFEKPVQADVMVENRKVAGAAQRRTRRGLLQQGSIQNVDLAERFSVDFAARLGRHCQPQALAEDVMARALEISGAKYTSAAWLQRW
jgi:lipoyl(octanoyl) transferase